MTPLTAMEELAALMEAGDPFLDRTGTAQVQDDNRIKISYATDDIACLEQELIQRDITNSALEMENTNLNSLVQELQERVLTSATAPHNTANLQKSHDQLVEDINVKKLELAMLNVTLDDFEQARRTQAATETLQESNRKLASEVGQLKVQLNDVRDQKSRKVDDLASQCSSLQRGKAFLETKVKSLELENESVRSQFATLEYQKKLLDTERKMVSSELDTFRANNETLRREISDLRSENSALKRRNDVAGRQQKAASALARQNNQVKDLKDENNILQKKVDDFCFNIAQAVTEADVVEEGLLVNVCTHTNLDHIPRDGRYRASKFRAGVSASKRFQFMGMDPVFIKNYHGCRGWHVEHARAHGDHTHAKYLGDFFLKLDTKRGAIPSHRY